MNKELINRLQELLNKARSGEIDRMVYAAFKPRTDAVSWGHVGCGYRDLATASMLHSKDAAEQLGEAINEES